VTGKIAGTMREWSGVTAHYPGTPGSSGRNRGFLRSME
jgi:hypothetical protein